MSRPAGLDHVEGRLVGRRLALALGLLAVLAAVLAAPAGAVVITEFQLPAGSGPFAITAGSDGNMWFTDKGNNTIGKIGMGGEVTQYGLGITPNAGLNGITSGPEGNLWFTERSGHKVGRITPSGAVTEFSVGLTGTPDIYGIAPGPEGNLWFTETFNSRLGVISPVNGSIREVSVPTAVYTNIVRGVEGDLWYTASDLASINRTTPAGSTAAFGPLSAGDCANGAPTPCPYPDALTVGPEGNLWTNEARGNAIVRVTPSGSVSEFTDGLTHGAGVAGLAVGPEGNIWFTESQANQIGRITPAGLVTEFNTGLSGEATPRGIALGPDQNLWVTESTGDKIAQVIPDVPPIVATGGPAAAYRTHAVVTGTVRSRGSDTNYFFEYGTTTSYGGATAPVGNGGADNTMPVGAELKQLTPGTEYHYRIVAQNANGTSYGADATFATAPEVRHKKKQHKLRLTVKPFQMYFSGRSLGRRGLQLNKITVLGLRRGERVGYSCKRCAGKPSHARRRARRSRLVFSVHLVVNRRSGLRMAVVGKGGSERLKVYGFRVAAAESTLKRQRCFAAGKKHKRVSCGGGSKHHGSRHGGKGHRRHRRRN